MSNPTDRLKTIALDIINAVESVPAYVEEHVAVGSSTINGQDDLMMLLHSYGQLYKETVIAIDDLKTAQRAIRKEVKALSENIKVV